MTNGEPMSQDEADRLDRILDYTHARVEATILAVDSNGNAFPTPPDPFQTKRPSADPAGADTGATRT